MLYWPVRKGYAHFFKDPKSYRFGNTAKDRPFHNAAVWCRKFRKNRVIVECLSLRWRGWYLAVWRVVRWRNSAVGIVNQLSVQNRAVCQFACTLAMAAMFPCETPPGPVGAAACLRRSSRCAARASASCRAAIAASSLPFSSSILRSSSARDFSENTRFY